MAALEYATGGRCLPYRSKDCRLRVLPENRNGKVTASRIYRIPLGLVACAGQLKGSYGKAWQSELRLHPSVSEKIESTGSLSAQQVMEETYYRHNCDDQRALVAFRKGV